MARLGDKITEAVYRYSTKYKEGFIQSELEELLKQYPDINMDKYNDALMGITCMAIDGQAVIYHCDVAKAIICGIENRGLKVWEWD